MARLSRCWRECGAHVRAAGARARVAITRGGQAGGAARAGTVGRRGLVPRRRQFCLTLLAYVNLLLTPFGGAALATAARLQWDPSAYVVLRAVVPVEYRASTATLTALGAALLLLPHLPTLAAHCTYLRRHTRPLLMTYAALMSCAMLTELVFCVWMYVRLMKLLACFKSYISDGAMGWLRLLHGFLGTVHAIPEPIERVLHWFTEDTARRRRDLSDKESLLNEVVDDLPRNLYVAVGAGICLALLQILAVVLALCTARNTRVTRTYHAPKIELSHVNVSAASSATTFMKKPVRIGYKMERTIGSS